MAKENTKSKKKFFTGTGRRKTAVARVWLYDTKGEIEINNILISDYFKGNEDTLEWVKPFHAIGIAHPQSKYSASVKIQGGGRHAQLEAVKLGFARALINLDEGNKAVLRDNDLLTRDSRKVERKKPYFKKARKKPQYSKR